MTQYILSVNRAMMTDDNWRDVFRGDEDEALDESRWYLKNGYEVRMDKIEE